VVGAANGLTVIGSLDHRHYPMGNHVVGRVNSTVEHLGGRRENWTRRVPALGLLGVGLALTLAGARSTQAGEWTPLGPYGGTIEALAIDPVTPSIIYVGT